MENAKKIFQWCIKNKFNIKVVNVEKISLMTIPSELSEKTFGIHFSGALKLYVSLNDYIVARRKSSEEFVWCGTEYMKILLYTMNNAENKAMNSLLMDSTCGFNIKKFFMGQKVKFENSFSHLENDYCQLVFWEYAYVSGGNVIMQKAQPTKTRLNSLDVILMKDALKRAIDIYSNRGIVVSLNSEFGTVIDQVAAKFRDEQFHGERVDNNNGLMVLDFLDIEAILEVSYSRFNAVMAIIKLDNSLNKAKERGIDSNIIMDINDAQLSLMHSNALQNNPTFIKDDNDDDNDEENEEKDVERIYSNPLNAISDGFVPEAIIPIDEQSQIVSPTDVQLVKNTKPGFICFRSETLEQFGDFLKPLCQLLHNKIKEDPQNGHNTIAHISRIVSENDKNDDVDKREKLEALSQLVLRAA